jgi:hypothetical protein
MFNMVWKPCIYVRLWILVVLKSNQLARSTFPKAGASGTIQRITCADYAVSLHLRVEFIGRRCVRPYEGKPHIVSPQRAAMKDAIVNSVDFFS